ncbi:MAG: SUMF1/EgtB/PvdO family nonheme iron enzyme [Candidatus Hydrogenedentes bacterium]|nr:SUMF1/EgtB/PvdO family nonheme iron enzyme [Candidatus Hydrogenedentota bacterium]
MAIKCGTGALAGHLHHVLSLNTIRRCAAVFALIFACFCPAASGTEDTLLRAFPGAEGFGACTPGGRGGAVHYVTTLEDYAPGAAPIEGSLRAAVEADGPRLVLFRVSGTIDLKADLWIQKPFITIAGQTAPENGICIKDYQFVLATNDIIIRHLRFRSGDLTRKEQMAVGIFGGNNCILDHCSMTWAIDEVMSAFGAYNFTAQWCIIAEGLSHSYHPKGEHSKGSILDGTGGFTIHHCLYAHNAARNPRINTIVLDFRNNVLYDWGYRAAYTTEAPSYVNWVANYLKPGPSTRKSARTKIFDPGDDMPRVYFEGNVLEGFESETTHNALFINTSGQTDPNAFRAMMAVPEAFLCPPVATDAAAMACERVLAEAGATLPKRDHADERLMNEVRTGTGRIIDSPADVGGWPMLESRPAPPDTDRDGMPDAWESEHGFAPQDAEDGNGDADADGYTNVEEFLNATDPHAVESGCTVDARDFKDTLESAQRQSAEGMREFKERESNADAKRQERNAARATTLKIAIMPSDDPEAKALVVDLDGRATLEMVRIPAGTFLMGTPESEGGLERERPQHPVTISKPFYLCTTKTTTAQFVAVLGPESREATPENMDLPAKEVNWMEANEYCEVLSKATGRRFRLPTEAEWEYACRAGTTTAFSTGDTITTDQANFDGAEATPFNPAGVCRGTLTPSKMFPPNPWGLYDMHGNQAEYCMDYCFREYTAEAVTDPAGPATGGARVLRGGKATSKAYFLRSGYRYGYTPGVGYGFRVLLEP